MVLLHGHPGTERTSLCQVLPQEPLIRLAHRYVVHPLNHDLLSPHSVPPSHPNSKLKHPTRYHLRVRKARSKAVRERYEEGGLVVILIGEHAYFRACQIVAGDWGLIYSLGEVRSMATVRVAAMTGTELSDSFRVSRG